LQRDGVDEVIVHLRTPLVIIDGNLIGA